MKQNELLKELITLSNSLFEGELDLNKAKHFLDEYNRINKNIDLLSKDIEIDVSDDVLLLANENVRRIFLGDGLYGLAMQTKIGYEVRILAIQQQTAQ